MERDQAIDIATKFAVQFPKLEANATQVRDAEWCVRVILPGGVEARAHTRESARFLWQDCQLVTRSA